MESRHEEEEAANNFWDRRPQRGAHKNCSVIRSSTLGETESRARTGGLVRRDRLAGKEGRR